MQQGRVGKRGCAWWVLVSVSPHCVGASTGLGTFWLENSPAQANERAGKQFPQGKGEKARG